MSETKVINGHNVLGHEHDILEARLARSTMFREKDPFLRVQGTTSDPSPLGFFRCGREWGGWSGEWGV